MSLQRLKLIFSGYDGWILSMREYAEDTAFRALVSSTTTFSARRRTLFFFHTNKEVENPLRIVDNTEELWAKLNETLTKVDPKKIAINVRLWVGGAEASADR